VARFMLTVRKAVLFLSAHGHPYPSQIPLARIFLDADLIHERLDRERADAAILMRQLMNSLFDDEAAKDFKKRTEEMMGYGR